MIFHSISAFILALTAPQIAPLPDRVAPSNEAKVTGLYAESKFGLTGVNETLEQLEADCASRGVTPKIEGRDLQWSGTRRIYRTRDSIAVFEDNPSIEADPQTCTAQITLLRTVSVTAGSKNPGGIGWIGEHPACDGLRRYPRPCTEGVVAGVKAMCANLGDGLVGSTVCYSIQDDLSRDLVFARSNYTDDGSGPDNSWELDTVMTDALIDPVVFRRTS
jgi:hypothetical protein